MRRTAPATLVIAFVVGAVAGFAIDQLLTGSGRPSFTPTTMLPVFFVLLSLALVLLALPIRRATRGRTTVPVDPFRALRIAMLAKASAIVGALSGGVGTGLVVFLFTRPVPPSVGSSSAVIASIVGAAVLVAAGIVAETLCTIRKDDDDDQPGPPELDTTPSHH